MNNSLGRDYPELEIIRWASSPSSIGIINYSLFTINYHLSSIYYLSFSRVSSKYTFQSV
jgi:hypothetical protein